MTTGLLDVAMIVKNEQKDLPTALASLEALRPVLGNICIYDTGSTDRTVAIARNAGALVECGYWDDDFARARNQALAMTTSEWVLVIDADEIVIADAELMRRGLDFAGSADIDVCVSKLAVVTKGIVTSMADSIRIGRRSRVEYRNRLHERMVLIDGGGQPRAFRLSEEAITVGHLGYVPEALPQRAARNLRIAQLEHDRVADGDPDDLVEALLNRGRTYLLVGRSEDAVADFREAWMVEGAGTAYRQWAGEQLTEVLVALGELDAAEELLPGLSEGGCDPQLVRFIEAQIRFAQGRDGEALQLVRTVDRPDHALGQRQSWAKVLRLRMLSAANAGVYDEALAAGIALFGGHGGGQGMGPLLMRLWGDRPSAVLAELLAAAGTRHIDSVRSELEVCGEHGKSVAEALRGLVAARGPVDSTVAERS